MKESLSAVLTANDMLVRQGFGFRGGVDSDLRLNQ